MARTSNPDSATAQFFINTVDNERLDRSETNPGYCVFGRVIEGMDVVDAIRRVKTARTRISEGQPVETVVIKSVRRAASK
jgi:cyclophilin family peptidyl-prolyl cis-trans isomerase